MDERGHIYAVDKEARKEKSPEQIKEDEERLLKALQSEYVEVVGEQLERLAAEIDEDK